MSCRLHYSHAEFKSLYYYLTANRLTLSVTLRSSRFSRRRASKSCFCRTPLPNTHKSAQGIDGKKFICGRRRVLSSRRPREERKGEGGGLAIQDLCSCPKRLRRLSRAGIVPPYHRLALRPRHWAIGGYRTWERIMEGTGSTRLFDVSSLHGIEKTLD